MESEETEFGQLRSLMHAPDMKSDAWRARLWKILRKKREEDARVYQEVWIPYLTGFQRFFSSGALQTVSDVEALEEASRLAPFARFRFKVNARRFRPQDIETLIRSPHTDSLYALDLSHVILRDGFGALMENGGRFINLRALHVRHARLVDESISQLVVSGLFPGLEYLDVGDNDITDAGIRVLSRVSSSRLISLDVNNCLLSEEAVDMLNQACFASSLRELFLDGNKTGVACVAKARNMVQLRKLDVSSCGVMGADMRQMVRAHHLSGLTSLCMGNEDIVDEESAAALTDAVFLSSLEELFLYGFPVSLRMFEELSGKILGCLKTLTMENCGVDDACIVALSRSPWFAGIKQLNLMFNALTSEGVRAMTETVYPPEFEMLNLWSNRIDDEGAMSLANWPALSKAYHLSLGSNLLTDEGAAHLAKGRMLGSLTTLSLYGNVIGEEGKRLLSNSAFLSEKVRGQWPL